MAIILTAHAALMLAERGITLDWITQTIAEPDRQEPDPRDPAVTRSFRQLAEAGGRVLRVAHRTDGIDIRVVTAFLDRGARP
ncbi:MAG TPA: DUF4258 domain-containing protein [Acetobacteraceae bacterium]